MGDKIVPLKPHQKEGPDDRTVAESWAHALLETVVARREQEYSYPLKAPLEIRETAKRMGPLVGRYGFDSPVTFRAMAALLTMCHPIVLALMLSGIKSKAEIAADRRRPRGKA